MPLWTVPSRWADVSSTASGCWIFFWRLMNLRLMWTRSTTGRSYKCWWVGAKLLATSIGCFMPCHLNQTHYFDYNFDVWSWYPQSIQNLRGIIIIDLDDQNNFTFQPLGPLAKVWWLEKPTPESWYAYMEGAFQQPQWEGDLWAFHCPARVSGLFVQQGHIVAGINLIATHLKWSNQFQHGHGFQKIRSYGWDEEVLNSMKEISGDHVEYRKPGPHRPWVTVPINPFISQNPPFRPIGCAAMPMRKWTWRGEQEPTGGRVMATTKPISFILLILVTS